jgi:replication-associated recombination protein RarA
MAALASQGAGDMAIDFLDQGFKTPFSERMRPQKIEDLTLPQRHKARLQKMIDTGDLRNMIFYGPPGLGKTSAARVLAQNICGDYMRPLVINGSSATSVDFVRDKIEPYAIPRSVVGGHRLVLIDEADFLSKSAQAGLRNLIENSFGNCRFLFTANDVSKITLAIQSRMVMVDFSITANDQREVVATLYQRYLKVLTDDGVEFEQKKLAQLVAYYFPDLRKIAEQVAYERMLS